MELELIQSVNHRVETCDILEFKKVEDFSNSNYYLLCNSGKLKERVTTSAEASGLVIYLQKFMGLDLRGICIKVGSCIKAYQSYKLDCNYQTTKSKVSRFIKKNKN